MAVYLLIMELTNNSTSTTMATNEIAAVVEPKGDEDSKNAA